MTTNTDTETRAQVDVINFWCVVVLVVSAASVAGVVGAAVVAGEFADRNFNSDPANATETGVIMETNVDGKTSVRWSEKGDAKFLELHVDGERVDALNYVGDEVTMEAESFEVVAVYEGRETEVIDSHGL
ncbi:hypothetical protein [Halohasta salina]|uniref:hypothetical protein n=1 Tax=Halohasta salina TaxID=2961621 RepID=UPI0020A56F43|nr:hypothetical protein [Halohasta salina]